MMNDHKVPCKKNDNNMERPKGMHQTGNCSKQRKKFEEVYDSFGKPQTGDHAKKKE